MPLLLWLLWLKYHVHVLDLLLLFHVNEEFHDHDLDLLQFHVYISNQMTFPVFQEIERFFQRFLEQMMIFVVVYPNP